MPTRTVINQYLDWFAESLMLTYQVGADDLVKVTCHENLNLLNVSEVQDKPGCHMWRFRPDALVARRKTNKSDAGIHLLNATSGSISLKDVGTMNAMVRVTGAAVSAIVSPKGISKEVRTLQGDIDIRDRLFRFGETGKIILLSWEAKNLRVVQDAIIPIEDRDSLKSHRFQ